MPEINLGNHLYQIVNQTKHLLFVQGELCSLTYNAFDYAASSIKNVDQQEIELSYPIGYLPTKEQILTKRKYNKEELIARYSLLADTELAINGIYQLVIISEAMLSEVIRSVIMKYPQKIGTKKNISTGIILSASSIEEIHLHAVDSILNELSYKTPKDFAETFKVIVSVNLLECPAFHKYLELKATRDIYIHNRGVANDIYITKSGSHARVKSGHLLPVDVQYFLESYESCIQLTEWFEVNLHEVWHSSDYENNLKEQSKSNNNVNAQPSA